MTDEEKRLRGGAADEDGEMVLYDFFKHLTSLSLIALGGLLVVAQAADPKDVKRGFVVAAIIMIGAAGTLAFSGSSEIARARYTKTPVRKSLQVSRVGAPILLAIGAGLFLSMFVDTLD